MKVKCIAAMMLLFIAALSFGQEITADIRGTVHDPSGAVVSGATVQVTNTDKNIVERKLTTGADGAYNAPALPIGHYKITVDAPGFAPYVANNVVLNVNDHRTFDIGLKVGSQSQEVTVSEAPVQVDLQNPTASGLVNGTQIRELSVLSRNFVQLVTLQPGVTSNFVSDQFYVGASNPTGYSNQINISVNGNRPTQNSWLIDGADDFDRGANLTLLNYPSVDSIAEFKVLRSNYLPEHGRTSAGEVSIVTRSGTNQFHGSAYEFFRNDKLNANNYFNNKAGLKRPPLRWNDFGFTIGGPIKKDNTFFFYSQEWRHFIIYPTATSSPLPTTAEMSGNFATPVCTAFDASGNCSAMGTTISNIDPVASGYIKDIFSKLPLNLISGNRLVSADRTLYYYREEAVRIDHNFGQRVSLFGRYSDDSIPTHEANGLYTGEPLPGVATTDSNAPGRNLAFHVTATLSPTLINDGGYTFSWGAVVSNPVGTMAVKNAPDIKPNLPFTSSASIVPLVSFYDLQGLAGFGAYHDYNKNHTIFDTLSKTMGNHSLKFGGVVNLYLKDEDSNNYAYYTINDSASCGAASPAGCSAADGTAEQNWANFLLGRAYRFVENQAPIHYLVHQKQFEFFGQDEWRILPNFTLDYGLRYSLFDSPYYGNNMLSTFDPALYKASAAPAIDPATGLYTASVNTATLPGLIQGGHNSPFGRAVAPTPKGDVAPRVGFAWDPWGTGTTSIRGGYGIFYDSPAINNHEQGQGGNPSVAPATAYWFNTSLSSPTGPASSGLVPPVVWGPNPAYWKTPYTQMFDLDVQHQFTASTMLDIGYFGNLGRHLMGVVDVNMPHPLAFRNIPGYCAGYAMPTSSCFFNGFDVEQLNYVRPYPGFDAINLFTPAFTSNYNGLQAQFQKRFTNNSEVVLNYTWSHALTTASGDYRAAQNTYNLRGDYGNSDFDRRHVFSASYVYFLPFFKNQEGFTGHLLGGWELSGVVYLNSGAHWTSLVSSCRVDFAGLGLCGNTESGARPDQLGDPNQNAPHTVNEWFNTSVFIIPGCTPAAPTCHPTNPPVRPGDATRGNLVGPGNARWDASIFKNIKMTERFHAQFRAEFFNALNHTNFGYGLPSSPFGTSLTVGSTFGKIQNARDPRQIQLALKLIF